jgi:hypothetical protein
MFKTYSLIVGAVIFALACATRADQPHMQAALQALGNARAELQQATHDKGGHRARALKLVDQAMAEVQAGIAFDRRN